MRQKCDGCEKKMENEIELNRKANKLFGVACLLDGIKRGLFLIVLLLASMMVAGCATIEQNIYVVVNEEVVIENKNEVDIRSQIKSTVEHWCLFKLYCRSVSSYPYNLLIFMETKQTNYKSFTVEVVEIVYQNGDRNSLPQKVVLKSNAKIDNHDRYQYDAVFEEFLSEANEFQNAHLSIKGFTESTNGKYKYSIEFDISHMYRKRTEAAIANAG